MTTTRTIRRAGGWLVTLATALASGEAWAGDEARLGVHFENLVSGDAQPSIVLEPPEAVSKLTIRLTRKDGTVTTLSSGPIGAGGKKVLPVNQPVGEHGYAAHFEATFAGGGKSEFDMNFSLTRVDKLQLELQPENVDLTARRLTFRVNNPTKRAALEVHGKSGATIATFQQTYPSSSGSLTFTWDDPKQEILFMDFKVWDVADFWKGIRLSPFRVDIPHEEVEFESGKWDIRASEEPKLRKTLAQVKDAVDKYGKLIEMRLYVAGYTDTVGSKESNRALSQNRARAIATWYQKNGVRIPIFFQGFGEDVLAKPTPDETDEQANRRALYILSGQTPATSASLPRPSWSRL